MKRILIVFFILLSLPSSAQYRYAIGLGGVNASGRPKDIDQVGSISAMARCSRYFKLKKHFLINAGLELCYTRYTMDGYFFRDTNNTVHFGRTPDNYKQSQLFLCALRFAPSLDYALGEYRSGQPIMTIGIGPYIDYLFYTRQQYKTGTSNFKEKAPLEQKVEEGIHLELSVFGAAKPGKKSFGFHIGCAYQLSAFLKNKSSFHPYSTYFAIGYSL